MNEKYARIDENRAQSYGLKERRDDGSRIDPIEEYMLFLLYFGQYEVILEIRKKNDVILVEIVNYCPPNSLLYNCKDIG